MHCKNCGKDIPLGSQFCPVCGAGLDGTMPAGAMGAGGLSADDAKYTGGWSWGGFFAPWIFLFAHKQKSLGTKIFIVVLISWFFRFSPFFITLSPAVRLLGVLPGLAMLVISIWLGIKARSIVWKSGVYTNVADMKKKSKSSTTLTIAYVVIIIFVAIGGAMMAGAKLVAQEKALMSQSASENTPTTTSNTGTSTTPINGGMTVDQFIMQKALTDAKASDPNLVQAEFTKGYQTGKTDALSASSTAKLSGTETQSYQEGYAYGFVVSCMAKYNDKTLCSKKMMTALGVGAK
jgi:hypothetical protein